MNIAHEKESTDMPVGDAARDCYIHRVPKNQALVLFIISLPNLTDFHNCFKDYFLRNRCRLQQVASKLKCKQLLTADWQTADRRSHKIIITGWTVVQALC